MVVVLDFDLDFVVFYVGVDGDGVVLVDGMVGVE